MTGFSGRAGFGLEENELAQALGRVRERGELVLDLTLSNPTRAGLPFPGDEIRTSLATEGALTYEPNPRGPRAAREAVSRYYRNRGREVDPNELFLTASTSEAYGFLFKLLCDPADEVLVPVPSYPLFDFLAALDAVSPRPYPLRFDGTWHVDFAALESACSDRSRAVVGVHPNNPTGSYLSRGDRGELLTFAASRKIAVIVDEVFLDFPLSRPIEPESFAGDGRGLVFVLSGLSKLACLPQMKLAWIAVSGERELVREATTRLELIADTYLSVGAPVAIAAPRLLELAPRRAELASERTRENLKTASDEVARLAAVTMIPPSGPEGGWYLLLRLPAISSSDEWAIEILEKASVYVHPGSFFGFTLEAVIVLSLLTPPETFREGIVRLLRIVAGRLDSLDD